LPIFFGFLMNIGTAIIGIAMGGKLSGNFGGIADDEVSFGFAHLHGPSMFYLFLLVLPLIACLTGLRWIVRHRRGESPRAVSRACYRMAVPFALGWLALAYVGRIGLDTGRPIGGFHFGPQLFVGFLLALGWSGLLGAFYGRILLRRGTKLAARFPRAAPRRGPSWLVVSIVATAMIVGSGSAAVALHDDSGAGSSAVNSTPEPTPSESPPDVGELLPDPGLTAPPAEPRSDPVGDATARAVLTATAAAEERYRTKHGAYSSYDFELDSSPAPDGVALVVAYADSRRFCATASWYDSDVTYTYDSAVGKVQEGDNCDDISGSSTN
jgi:hypothetical protein